MRVYLNDAIHQRPRNNTLPKVVCEGRNHYTYSEKVEIWNDGVHIATVRTGKLKAKNHDVLAWIELHNGQVKPR